MRQLQSQNMIPVFRKVFDENGELIDVIQTGETLENVTELFADDGKQFIRIADGKIVGEHITIGTSDSVGNYSEV